MEDAFRILEMHLQRRGRLHNDARDILTQVLDHYDVTVATEFRDVLKLKTNLRCMKAIQRSDG